jgi:DNA-directed RNA polymerase subunit RPC12/RpoP
MKNTKQRPKMPLPPQISGEEPFGPPPKEYNYRCLVCGTELLVNEAIVEVGIEVGCPGCNNYTMKCVEPD